jgi:8-oxo-dGTP pyrophosphatase MutT (NUDIX family)
MRQKPPRKRAPSAGHVDRADGLQGPLCVPDTGFVGKPLYIHGANEQVFRDCAAREFYEETGFKVEADSLQRLFYYQADDDCAKIGEDGEPGGRHLWGVFAYEVKMISQPTLDDEPGKMHGWDFRSIGTLLADPELEPIWFDLLTLVGDMPESERGFALA